MWSGSRISLLIIQLIIFLMCVSYTTYIYIENILPDRQAKLTFTQTQCLIASKKLSTRGHFIRQYRADFFLTYNVGSMQYHRWVSGNGLDSSYSNHEVEQENLLSQFNVGGTYLCWYNPEDPRIVLLTFRHHWWSTFYLLLPLVIGAMIFYLLLKNIFQIRQSNRKSNKKSK